jgi:hypothetical protein
MAQGGFSGQITYLKKGDEFIKTQRPLIEKYMKVMPNDFIVSVQEIINKDVRQEELKKTVPQLTKSLEKETAETFARMSSMVKIVKGILEEKGKREVAKSLKSPSSNKSLDSKMNWLDSFKSFIEQNKQDLQGYPQLNPADISDVISKLSQRKKERDELDDEKKRTTKYIQDNLPKTVKKMADWMRILEGILGLEDKRDLIKQIPRQPVKTKKKASQLPHA